MLRMKNSETENVNFVKFTGSRSALQEMESNFFVISVETSIFATVSWNAYRQTGHGETSQNYIWRGLQT